ncbi:protein CONSERVED ONLY IN THE GREEN LINEAGE 160, chloroplastic-like isoform X1 [Lycium barbarum]|uniref:protein CONSERVED ONLY IN THE GREEN LINEAGE 160, chloroplastic-like isoform X1 n=1 Tax=Lycium barbarum TaxID=112863 RepID=UPI00293E1CB6|nr:protein CONSERVED ONLY IN THE GREEN LINEAGE 160, chloroplastic-like isoform X1 [Lycium barbarum]XP_060209495.1 protein CONSERVED ONLY IN THE GREEN LINEAGE 160, chloroplastic-like isoform X1 [Lycium barbarum]
MAVLNCHLSVTPKSQESSTNSSPTVPTKIILPKKKPMKWSTGDAPGEYGGPPTTTKLRRYWGKDEDPLTSDDFIWNKEFMGRMKKYVQENDTASRFNPVKEEPSGFLSLNRVMSLDSMEIDLTEKLIAPSKPMLDPQVNESQASVSASQKWRPAPTRREQEKWDRAAKAATGGSEVLLRETRRSKEDPNILAAQSEAQYLKLKDKLQLLTLGIGGVGIVSAYVSYSPEIAASYGAGLLGSLMYMRMLGNSVDSLRTDGPKALIKGAAGQPRLLVPVVLVMIYNRWNGILAAEYGLMHLELIPMLVGFFTYKIATFAQAIEEAVTIVGKKTET